LNLQKKSQAIVEIIQRSPSNLGFTNFPSLYVEITTKMEVAWRFLANVLLRYEPPRFFSLTTGSLAGIQLYKCPWIY